MHKDFYIFTGGVISDEIFAYLDLNNKEIIGVDHGIDWLLQHDIIPDYFVGDFDSIESSTLQLIKEKYADNLEIFSNEKDETDTELAMMLAISKNPNEITIFGGLGSRLDHVYANVNLLIQSERKNITSSILDVNNRIQILLPNKIKEISKSNFNYISLLPFSSSVKGINISGFKYPIVNGEMEIGYPYGISNELVGEKGTIKINEGILLIIESKD